MATQTPPGAEDTLHSRPRWAQPIRVARGYLAGRRLFYNSEYSSKWRAIGSRCERRLLVSANWEREVEGRPLPDLTLNPDAAPVSLDQALGDEEAEPQTFCPFARALCPKVPLEQAGKLVRRNAPAVVQHRGDDLAICAA